MLEVGSKRLRKTNECAERRYLELDSKEWDGPLIGDKSMAMDLQETAEPSSNQTEYCSCEWLCCLLGCCLLVRLW